MLIKTKIGNEEYTKKATVEDVLQAIDYSIKFGDVVTPMSIIDWACDFYAPVGLKKADLLALPSEDFTDLVTNLSSSFAELVGGAEEDESDGEEKK